MLTQAPMCPLQQNVHMHMHAQAVYTMNSGMMMIRRLDGAPFEFKWLAF